MVKASMSIICFEKYVFDKSDSIFYLTLPRARGSNAETLIFASPSRTRTSSYLKYYTGMYNLEYEEGSNDAHAGQHEHDSSPSCRL
jgi:hypothetical protein